jgi:hypothetical protein
MTGLAETKKGLHIGFKIMAEISEIIRDIVTKIDISISGTYNPATTKTDYCGTKWARKGKTVLDEVGNLYLVEEVAPNESLTVIQQNLPLVPLTGVTFLNSPYFQTGTKLAANSEWTKALNDLTKKTPLVWLLEIIREERFGRGDTREFETDLKIFFLDETDVTQYLTKDHRREVVEPMASLAESFLDVIRADRTFKRIDDYTLTSFSRFGVETDQGVVENILDANLSGVELQLTLTKYKNTNCKVC